MLKPAYKYMRYYKSQTFAILASIILTAALLSGVSSLIYSSQMNSLENLVWHSGRHLYFPDLQSRFLENHGLLYGSCSTIPAFYSRNSERNHGSGYDIKYCDCGHSSQHSSEKDCEIEYHK